MSTSHKVANPQGHRGQGSGLATGTTPSENFYAAYKTPYEASSLGNTVSFATNGDYSPISQDIPGMEPQAEPSYVL